MSSYNAIKLSVIGSGGWGNRLIRKFHGLCGVHMAYGHKNRKQLEHDLNITFTEDIDTLIHQSDVVVLAEPPMLNYDLGKKVLTAKKDLWMEKPMTFSSHEAAELAALADNSGLLIFVDHILCYGYPVETLRKTGKIVRGRGVFNKTSSENISINPQWYLGIHMVAIAVLLGIKPKNFTLESSYTAAKEERIFTVDTEDGKSLTWNILSPDFQQDMLFDACIHFLECIQTRSQPLTNGWHGVEVIKIMEMIAPDPFINPDWFQ